LAQGNPAITYPPALLQFAVNLQHGPGQEVMPCPACDHAWSPSAKLVSVNDIIGGWDPAGDQHAKGHAENDAEGG